MTAQNVHWGDRLLIQMCAKKGQSMGQGNILNGQRALPLIKIVITLNLMPVTVSQYNQFC
jgi:hypothetical protein